MKDGKVVIYQTNVSHMIARFTDGSLDIESTIYGNDDFWESEKHYVFNKQQTEKLLSIISIEELCKKCKSAMWLEQFLEKHNLLHSEAGI